MDPQQPNYPNPLSNPPQQPIPIQPPVPQPMTQPLPQQQQQYPIQPQGYAPFYQNTPNLPQQIPMMTQQQILPQQPPQPGISQQPPQQYIQPQPQTIRYAGFWRRFFASIIDIVILFCVIFIIALVGNFLLYNVVKTSTSLTSSNMVTSDIFLMSTGIFQTIGMLIFITYNVYFIGKKGQTPGKMAMKIKVVHEHNGQPPGYIRAILREIVGKAIESMTILPIGYLWSIWDAKKQTWHDKIASTIVIRV